MDGWMDRVGCKAQHGPCRPMDTLMESVTGFHARPASAACRTSPTHACQGHVPVVSFMPAQIRAAASRD
eukprot:361791-Chlamydomonas_euryale.AAC.3